MVSHETNFSVVTQLNAAGADRQTHQPVSYTHAEVGETGAVWRIDRLGRSLIDVLPQGDPVIVVGEEHTASWGDDGNKQYGRVLDARVIGVDLTRAVAQIRRISKSNDQA